MIVPKLCQLMEENALYLFLQTSQQEQYQQMPLHSILNYFLIVGKLCLLSCRRNQTFSNISGFRANIVLQGETDKNTSTCTYSKMKIFLKPNGPYLLYTLLIQIEGFAPCFFKQFALFVDSLLCCS